MSETKTNNALEPRSAAEDLEAVFDARANSDPIKFSGIDVFKLGEVLAKSGFFVDTKDAAQAIVKILAGQELGIGPIASMSGIDIVQGRPELSANLLAALIKGSGRYNYRTIRLDDEGCHLEIFERLAGGWTKLGDSVFTKRDASAAGLIGKTHLQTIPQEHVFCARADQRRQMVLSGHLHWRGRRQRINRPPSTARAGA